MFNRLKNVVDLFDKTAKLFLRGKGNWSEIQWVHENHQAINQSINQLYDYLFCFNRSVSLDIWSQFFHIAYHNSAAYKKKSLKWWDLSSLRHYAWSQKILWTKVVYKWARKDSLSHCVKIATECYEMIKNATKAQGRSWRFLTVLWTQWSCEFIGLWSVSGDLLTLGPSYEDSEQQAAQTS